ncbi:hypothetical protein [Neisseria sp. Ec49-e6-T10]|uniref:hypothetical protein n=1 Tax=Neisseria sp. Ec49-e6-T10 TaxID=3140744 RepID=UPI003EC11C56
MKKNKIFKKNNIKLTLEENLNREEQIKEHKLNKKINQKLNILDSEFLKRVNARIHSYFF